METDEFIEILRQLVTCYDMCTSMVSPFHREISMWRDRFIDVYLDVHKITDKRTQLLISKYFRAIPSKSFIEMTPEECIENFIDEIKMS